MANEGCSVIKIKFEEHPTDLFWKNAGITG